jgi:hypothetical protein
VEERFGPTSEDFPDDFVLLGSGEDTDKAVSSENSCERVCNLLPSSACMQQTGVPFTPHIASSTLKKLPNLFVIEHPKESALQFFLLNESFKKLLIFGMRQNKEEQRDEQHRRAWRRLVVKQSKRFAYLRT